MAKSIRSKMEKRLRAIRRELVVPIYEKKEVAKLAVQEAALATPNLPVKLTPLSSAAASISSANHSAMGIGFMMAPAYHPAMQIVRPVRKKLKVKTVFNILSPLLDPAKVPFAAVGVFGEDLVHKMAKAVQSFGISALDWMS